MRYFNQGRFRQQVRFLQHQFLQDGNLPFSDILSTELIKRAVTALQVEFVGCVYTPLVTSSVSNDVIAQPTALRLNKSSTTAR